jgi:hypothetical protein
MMAGARRADLDTLVLWDPVVDGGGYLKELLQLQKEMSSFRPKPRTGKSADSLEILGFPLVQHLCSELEEINLLNIVEAPAKAVLVIESRQAEGGNRDLKDRLARLCTHFEQRRVDSPQIWLPTSNGSLLVPSSLLQSLVSWTCQTHS